MSVVLNAHLLTRRDGILALGVSVCSAWVLVSVV